MRALKKLLSKQTDSMQWAAILLMAGSSERFGDETPKQFQLLFGKPLFLFPLQTLLSFSEFSKIYLVIAKPWKAQTEAILAALQDQRLTICIGGKTRQQSSFFAIQKAYEEGINYVLIHDAARPLVSKKIIRENLFKTPSFKAVDTCLKATDTLVQSKSGIAIDSIPNRNHMYQGQTPQSFETKLILHAHEMAQLQDFKNASDDCSLILRLGYKVGIVQGENTNFKITTPYDLLFAERLLPFLPEPHFEYEESLKNKKYVLCGATGDIGKAIEFSLLQEGAQVIRLSKSSENPIDLSDPLQTKKKFEMIFEEHGLIDGLILATGSLHVKKYKDLTLKEIDQSLKANLLSYLYPIKYAKLKEKGHILALSSSSYLKGRKDIALYSALKASIVNFIQGLAEEMPQTFVNAIAPCRCKGRMRQSAFPKEDPSFLLDPEEVSKKAIWILKSHFTGTTVDVRKESSLHSASSKEHCYKEERELSKV